MSWLFTSQSQSIRASASVLPMTIQGWFLLGLTGLISLLSKGLSRVFSSTTIQKIQFFSAQPSLWSSFHIHTWLLGFGGRDIEKLCMAKIKTMFSNPEPLVLTLIYVSWTDTHCFFFFFYPELIHISVGTQKGREVWLIYPFNSKQPFLCWVFLDLSPMLME